MMKRYIWAFLITISIFSLTAGGSNESNAAEPEQAMEEKESEQTGITADEAEKIVKGNLSDIDEVMAGISRDVFEQGVFDDWFEIIDNRREATETAIENVANNKNVMDLVTEQGFEDMIGKYLYVYMGQSDIWGIVRESDIVIRFQLLEQTENSFKVSTLRLATEAEYDPPETIVLDYVKEDEKWKLAGYQTISTEEEPFNLTFEDLQYSFTDYETGKVIEGEFVDEIEHDGENYLVIKYGEYQMVRNVKDSTFGYFDLEDNSEKQPEEDQKEDQKEEKTDVEKEASSSNEGVPSGKSDEKELLNYETITKEVDEDHLKFDVSYPKFSYEALDQPILSYVKEMLEEEKTYAEELFSGKIEGIEKGSYDEYEFSISFEVSSITESFVSVEFLEYRYHVGSAHGLHYSKTFNYDLKNNREITLKDVLNNDMSKVKIGRAS